VLATRLPNGGTWVVGVEDMWEHFETPVGDDGVMLDSERTELLIEVGDGRVVAVTVPDDVYDRDMIAS
jgi:hypothetical protein